MSEECTLCEVPISDYGKSKHVCKTCNSNFCPQCFPIFCDTGGGQDLNIYFDCPRCSGKIFCDNDLLDFLLKKYNITKEETIEEYKKWKLETKYKSEKLA